MKAFCEFLILTLCAVTDEAGKILDGLVQKRGQVLNQAVRQADPAKKRERKWPRFLQCKMIDSARPFVGTCFEANDTAEIDICKSSLK